MQRQRLKKKSDDWHAENVDFYVGDVIDALKKLPEKSVHCMVTSPPYFGLRDYDTAKWKGGDQECDHLEITREQKFRGSTLEFGKVKLENRAFAARERQYASVCKKCGAKRIDKQIGMEKTPQEYVQKMVEVFREIKRVLRDDGVAFLNLGDSYSSKTVGDSRVYEKRMGTTRLNVNRDLSRAKSQRGGGGVRRLETGLKPGNLLGIPWRVAFALQDDGWILRQDIIWAKSGPMPEPVKNRCTKAHEYIFLLTKRQKYYFDTDAIATVSAPWNSAKNFQFRSLQRKMKHMTERQLKLQQTQFAHDSHHPVEDQQGANKRSVWVMGGASYEDAHFAVFPDELPETCILAGTSEKGSCGACGSPWRRLTSAEVKKVRSPERGKRAVWDKNHWSAVWDKNHWSHDGLRDGHQEKCVKTTGWEPTCECNGKFVDEFYWIKHSATGKKVKRRRSVYVPEIPLEDHPIVPCVVLDPFAGSGTTLVAALRLHRRGVGIDLGAEYAKMAQKRIEGILNRPTFFPGVRRKS